MKSIDEEIMFMLGTLNAMSRRGGNLPPPPPPGPGDSPMMPPHHGQGRERLMGFLADNGEMSQSQIAAHLDIRPQSLSELLAKVEADGLIMRRQSEEDKRQTLVSLTDAGRARVDTFRENHKRRAAEFLAPLDEAEKETFAAILKKLIDAKKDDEKENN